MSFETIVSPAMPPPCSFERLRWAIRLSFIKRWLRDARIEQIQKMRGNEADVEHAFREHLIASWRSLGWNDGKPIRFRPYFVTAKGNEMLDANFALNLAAQDVEKIQSREMCESDYLDLHGFAPDELYIRQLDYLDSVSSDSIIKCDSATLHQFEHGWGLILGRISDEPVVACLGIYPDPIDALFPADFRKHRVTKPIWDRFDELSQSNP